MLKQKYINYLLNEENTQKKSYYLLAFSFTCLCVKGGTPQFKIVNKLNPYIPSS